MLLGKILLRAMRSNYCDTSDACCIREQDMMPNLEIQKSYFGSVSLLHFVR